MGDNIIKDLFGNSLNYLQKEAVRIRNEIYGKKVYIRGLIEFSNYCARNCLYCGLRKDNRNLIIKIFVRYSFVSSLFLAISLTIRLLIPISEKTTNNTVNDNAKLYLPNPTSPRYLAM